MFGIIKCQDMKKSVTSLQNTLSLFCYFISNKISYAILVEEEGRTLKIIDVPFYIID